MAAHATQDWATRAVEAAGDLKRMLALAEEIRASTAATEEQQRLAKQVCSSFRALKRDKPTEMSLTVTQLRFRTLVQSLAASVDS